MKGMLIAVLLVLLTACSSVELEKGPSVEQVYFNDTSSGSRMSTERIDKLRAGLIPNPRFDISDPTMPVVRPPLAIPIYVRGKRTRYYQESGRWVHEIVDPGGFIN